MTTRPSSSRRASTMTSKTLFDAACRTVLLGDEIGHGGEGSVYEVDGEFVVGGEGLPQDATSRRPDRQAASDDVAAGPLRWKRLPPGRDRCSSIRSRSKPCGLLMTKMVGARPLHELYGTTNRRRHFPDVGWHHLVLAARNAAAAFHTLHSAGIVVGDVNQGNLLVDKQMCVRMIDCDSFQITREGKTFNCPVGTPHFTPPELQGKKLRDVVRTVNHDRFGLATLIFHLMFVGRHPFAGRFRGTGDLSIEKAIAETPLRVFQEPGGHAGRSASCVAPLGRFADGRRQFVRNRLPPRRHQRRLAAQRSDVGRTA